MTGGHLEQVLKEWTGHAGLADQQDPLPAQAGDLGSDCLRGGTQKALAPFPHPLAELGDVPAIG
jgi:hypothetical protein